MKYLSTIAILCILIATSCSTKPTEVEDSTLSPSWQLGGFVHPESIVFSETDSCLYISNIGTNDTLPDGFISKVSLDGVFIDTMWCDGLYSPKGIHISKGFLYVNDLKVLKKIDMEHGEVIASFSIESIGMLNDVTSDDAGNIYTSDMVHSAIYKLDSSGTFEMMYQNDSLHHPNGVYFQNGKLYIGSWGSFENNFPEEDSIGHFFMLDIQKNSLQAVSTTKLGKLDGIQTKGDAFLVSAWKTGEVFLINNNGEAKLVLESETSLGDILYLEKEKMIFLPLNFQNRVEAKILK